MYINLSCLLVLPPLSLFYYGQFEVNSLEPGSPLAIGREDAIHVRQCAFVNAIPSHNTFCYSYVCPRGTSNYKELSLEENNILQL
jgi:hypothetical protein